MKYISSIARKILSKAHFYNLKSLNFKRMGLPLNVSPGPKNSILLRDKSKQIYIAREKRIHRYIKGISFRCQTLADQYHLNLITLRPGDVFLDCGANIGELGIWAHENNLQYIAIEPESDEADCCDLNNFHGDNKTARLALWKQDDLLTFYSSPDEADGSLIAPSKYVEQKTVKALTLQNFMKEYKVDKIRIFKLEAEGAEPEILQGAIPVLKHVDFITADCGYERGAEKKHTFLEVDAILRSAGFELIAADFKRVTVLYKNLNVSQ